MRILAKATIVSNGRKECRVYPEATSSEVQFLQTMRFTASIVIPVRTIYVVLDDELYI